MRKIGFIITIIIIAVPFLTATAQRYKTEKISYPAEDIELLIIDTEIGAAEINISTDDIEEVVKGDIEYDSRKVEIITDYDLDGDVGFLRLANDISDKWDIDTEDNIWDMVFSTRYEAEIGFELGACTAEIDLGGIPIIQLDMQIGAAEGLLEFSRPNPTRADRVTFETGASKFTVEKLGNANFKRMDFEGGVGKFKLDFSGEYTGKSKARISVGLGAVTILIPRDLPVRIEAEDSFLSHVDFINADDYDIDDDYYESEDFTRSEVGLSLDIEVGLGSVDIEWID
jgi:hypothetical protein